MGGEGSGEKEKGEVGVTWTVGGRRACRKTRAEHQLYKELVRKPVGTPPAVQDVP